MLNYKNLCSFYQIFRMSSPPEQTLSRPVETFLTTVLVTTWGIKKKDY